MGPTGTLTTEQNGKLPARQETPLLDQLRSGLHQVLQEQVPVSLSSTTCTAFIVGAATMGPSTLSGLGRTLTRTFLSRV